MLLFGCIITLLASSWAELQEDDLHRFIRSPGFHEIYGHGNEGYEITTPIHTGRIARNIGEHPDQLTYILEAFGNRLELNLKKVYQDSMIKLVSRNEDGTITENIKNVKGCLYHGNITSQKGWVAVTTCDGLSGIIRTPDQDYVIQSLPEHMRNKRDANFPDEIPHVLFKQGPIPKGFCGAVHKLEDEVKSTVRRQANAQNARKLTVETAMFVDNALYNHFRTVYTRNTDDSILQFVMSTINAIQLMYNYPSLLGIPVLFVVIRVDIIKNTPAGLRVVDNAEQYLNNFCKWQSTENVGDDLDPGHWDHTFMLTGVDIKADDGNSGVIGIAPVSAMCRPQHSCTLTEAKYFLGVSTGAHEAGHNFGMLHDGAPDNQCNAARYVMAAMAGEGQNEWSSCSRQYMKDYLRNPVTVCLLDERNPSARYDHASHELPGQIYDSDIQCEMGYGEGAERDRQQAQHEICDSLKCQKDRYTYSPHAALDGTHCAPNAWCRRGSCIGWGRPAPQIVNGGWGPFGSFSTCSSDCLNGGTGVSMATRYCNSPRAKNGGNECQGDQTNIKLCNDNNMCRVRKSNDQYAAGICANAPTNIAPSIVARGTQLFHDQTGGCLVWCEKRVGGGQYSGFGKEFPDGTDCSQGLGKAYCIKGMCKKF